MKKSGSEKNLYIPSRGDIVWLDFDPRTGREQSGHRPAIVISPKEFNGLSSLVFVCPITSKVKGFSFEVPLTTETKIGGVVLIHHLRSVDWRARNIKFIEQAPVSVINEICAKLKPLMFVT
ncbi:type II toxin-antitoxin system PemK/MazF family toxin [Crocosphaera sp.]|uniref:type II toxin-antitoxin system PemK/MazF family toxin n=1 Tax=Crocosphaera sp. TaxID=2729996 RepID=UPI00261BF9FB|nr:type II toxin-antitoxin system PemK/MazF family toxin [Crocosphaera sp.]MDJ0579329.1 type II toxin-antitoxin system PemK/MazF family toxin [Crocosphaera sp.]